MKILLFSLFIIGVFGGIWFWKEMQQGEVEVRQLAEREEVVVSTVEIHGNELEAEIARTTDEQARGLSGRAHLAENAGMLFVYEQPTMPGFWMNDMRFALDLIWIDENQHIIAITENVAPETFPEIFYPPSPVQYVLEVNAGWAESHNISIGDEAMLYGIF